MIASQRLFGSFKENAMIRATRSSVVFDFLPDPELSESAFLTDSLELFRQKF
jgi:hypothetical protein